MSEDYLWDGQGTPDPLVAQLEQRLAPLGEEAEAMLSALELDGEHIDHLASVQPSRHDARAAVASGGDGPLAGETADEATVLSLPFDSREPSPARGDRRSWLRAAAAAVLVAASLAGLAVIDHRRGAEGRLIAVAGAGGPRASVELELLDVVDASGRSHASQRWPALEQLRSRHRELARCALLLDGSSRVKLELAIGPTQTELIALSSAGDLPAAVEACLRRSLVEWRPQGLPPGTLVLGIELQGQAQVKQESSRSDENERK